MLKIDICAESTSTVWNSFPLQATDHDMKVLQTKALGKLPVVSNSR